MAGISEFVDKEFGKLRVQRVDGEPWFNVGDVTRALEYEDITDAMRCIKIGDKLGGFYAEWISESGVISLIENSKSPSARFFEIWVNDILLNFHVVNGVDYGEVTGGDLEETKEVLETMTRLLKELEQYRSIGTVDECREAVNKFQNIAEGGTFYESI